MSAPSFHDVSDARIAYWTAGSGPVLLLIPGASGIAATWTGVARHLTSHFTVLTYDRRGLGLSTVSSTEGLDKGEIRVAYDADDAATLVRHVAAQGREDQAFVVGGSSGATVALELLARHPDVVRKMIAHEPPLSSVLPPPEQIATQYMYDQVYWNYKSSGQTTDSVKLFADNLCSGTEAELMKRALLHPRAEKNTRFSIEHEVRQFPRLVPKWDALKRNRNKLVMGMGKDSTDTLRMASQIIAKEVGVSCETFSGGHVGYFSVPKNFAEEVKSVLLTDAKAKI